MKSNTQQLENRGFVAVGISDSYYDTTFEQRVALLKSKLPTNRTIGARLLAQHSGLSAINYLTKALTIEKKLYTKIEICHSLISFGIDAVVPLIGLLGLIGNNQHKEVAKTDFKKDNYPLPRDIASRTLIRIGTQAIPDLLTVLDSNNLKQKSEAIDTIGYICFYAPQPNVFEKLKKCFDNNVDNDLIKWKTYRAMSAFPESEPFLREQLKLGHEWMDKEIERSLALLLKRS